MGRLECGDEDGPGGDGGTPTGVWPALGPRPGRGQPPRCSGFVSAESEVQRAAGGGGGFGGGGVSSGRGRTRVTPTGPGVRVRRNFNVKAGAAAGPWRPRCGVSPSARRRRGGLGVRVTVHRGGVAEPGSAGAQARAQAQCCAGSAARA